MNRALLYLMLVLFASCGGEETDRNNGATTNTNTAANDHNNDSGTNNAATTNTGGTSGGAETITVGVYKRTGETTYEKDTNADELVFNVGVACGTWSRRVAMPGAMDTVQTEHDHFNAADSVVYENGQLSWIEYGPEHSQEEIDATCAGGAGGKVKEGVNDTDYFFDGNMGETDDDGNYIGFYLKIDSVQ